MPFKTGEKKTAQGINATFAILFGLSISLSYAIWFWFTKMHDLLNLINAIYSNEDQFKKFILASTRELGFVIQEDKQRIITLRRDIYELAYALCLNQEELEEYTKDEPEEEGDEPPPKLQNLPLQTQVNEVFIAAIICAVSVVYCSTFVMKDANKGMKCEDKDKNEYECFKYVSWELQVSRLICACLFHFLFEEEIQSAMRLMKYVTLN